LGNQTSQWFALYYMDSLERDTELAEKDREIAELKARLTAVN